MGIDRTLEKIADKSRTTPDRNIPTVHLYSQNTEALSEDTFHDSMRILSEEERERCDRLRFKEDRRDFVAAHALLRRSLSAYLPRRLPEEWGFETGPRGKPALSRAPVAEEVIEFNLSHTRGFVACAISSVRVGLDVERIHPETKFIEIAEHFFHSEETSTLKTLSPHEAAVRFIELWTLKEALLKGLGIGISEQLQKTLVDIKDSGPICIQAPAGVKPDGWKFAILAPEKNLRLAVAVESVNPPRIFQNGLELFPFSLSLHQRETNNRHFRQNRRSTALGSQNGLT
jgi:4'-phosphopantetheinyl transferase